MFKPKYLIRLDITTFPNSQAICLGSQLISIIKNLHKLMQPHIWYCADMDVISSMPLNLGMESFNLKKIGDDFSLIKLCENISQFLSGVFIAILEKTQTNPSCFKTKIGTEDEQFRFLNLDGVLIEIRAFDTSYFEIYSEDHFIMKKLAELYEIKIQQ